MSSLRGNRKVWPPHIHNSTKNFRQDIDLLVVVTDVKMLKKTVPLKHWRQWLEPFVPALSPSNIWNRHPT